jgi:signal peptidase
MSRPRAILYLRDVAVVVGSVLVVGAVLFAAAGVWPPLVAIESPSMEPSVERGDMVAISDPDRFSETAADDRGVVTAAAADGYGRLGGAGDVIVFDPPGRTGAPIIHRAQFRVEAGENWYGEANASYLGDADSCAELSACPAPYDGYVTKGDNNGEYDQATGIAPVVRPSWIEAKAQFRIPELGWIRLLITGKAFA